MVNIAEYQGTLLHLLGQINQNMAGIFPCFYSIYDLTPAQAKPLAILRQEGDMTLGDLSRHLMMAGGNLSPLCKKLESLGYLTRNRCREDERSVVITLTEKGNSLLIKIEEDMSALCQAAFTQQTEEDLASIITGLTKLNALLTGLKDNLNKGAQHNET